MIKNPLAIVFILLSIETAILYISSQKRFQKYFSFLPGVFWIYFIPMLVSTFGLIDAQSFIYKQISNTILPVSLLILLVTVDIKAISRLGKTALIMFFAGSAGIVLGAPLVFLMFKNIIGEQFWAGFGALSASWTGGSANMIAVKEAMNTPDAVFLPMVIVDTIVPYVWMGILVASVSLEPLYDRWNRSNKTVLNELSQRVSGVGFIKDKKMLWPSTILIVGGGLLLTLLTQTLAKCLPEIKDVISTYAWTIIIVSILGIIFSLTPLKKIEQYDSSKIGYFLLYFVLTTIGAKANISNIGSSLILIMAGFVLVLFHAFVLVGVGKILRAPMFLVATASQANIGGVASAPIVAEIYQPGLASVGLLLAVLGNIVGTYLGILAGQLCRWVAQM